MGLQVPVEVGWGLLWFRQEHFFTGGPGSALLCSSLVTIQEQDLTAQRCSAALLS